MSPDDPPDCFPPVTAALREPDGLLAAGGNLSAERLLYAYRNGIFPWYEDRQPVLWWSPDPRCVFMPGDHRVSRRLRRELRLSTAELRVNTSFSDVMRECAGPRRSQQGTWITPAMRRAYRDLHDLGWAHSIEVWQSGKLVGGLYGLAIGKAFFGESMFTLAPNASKIALLYVANRLNTGELEILDCQVVSSHLSGLGARIIPRQEFTQRLASACEPDEPFTNWPNSPTPCAELLCG
ncbi:MAG: leucyl/phenylalanyl-tRNA--protein transferase [Woeseiaceae bacterium]|nr:leucyl/phenylalanyl-tRNA--protein transferase [Woeseiaceae bacterium]